jgi:cysteine synthase A
MESILEAIGNTPLIRVHRCAPENGAEFWLKLELRNPSGSLKDRMALALGPGAVIVTLAVDTGFKYLSISPYGDE